MDIQSFRATRRVLTIEQAQAECDYLRDIWLGDYSHCLMYDQGTWILSGRKGYYLASEGDEYESRDIALLEFILWQWSYDTPETETIRRMIWES